MVDESELREAVERLRRESPKNAQDPLSCDIRLVLFALDELRARPTRQECFNSMRKLCPTCFDYTCNAHDLPALLDAVLAERGKEQRDETVS